MTHTGVQSTPLERIENVKAPRFRKHGNGFLCEQALLTSTRKSMSSGGSYKFADFVDFFLPNLYARD